MKILINVIIAILSHFPFLRISEDHIPFLVGYFFKLSFEEFNPSTIYYSTKRDEYQRVEPVFFVTKYSIKQPMIEKNFYKLYLKKF